MSRLAWMLASWGLLSGVAVAEEPVRVASKTFTESVVLGEMVRHLVSSAGTDCAHQAQLGGTQILWKALVNGDIDIYPEYTGTLRFEVLAGEEIAADADLPAALARHGIRSTGPLGFNNTYALGMRKDVAADLGVRTMSDLTRHPGMRFGFSNEFIARADGWPALQRAYALPQQQVRGLDHDIAYRALQTGDVDLIDLYTTDAEIDYYDLAVLEDDRAHFPRYDALILYRADLAERHPRAAAALERLAGRIPAEAMVAMNARAKLDKVPAAQVAGDFLAETFAIDVEVVADTWYRRLLKHTREHLWLVVCSMLPAILVAIPLGLLAGKRRHLSQLILGAVGVIQTIPALALLVLLMGPLGWLRLPAIGEPPAIVALFLYSLLPIVRSTFAGLQEIPPHLRESAEALGLTPAAQLVRVELPLATRMILSGVKTAVVINIGFATLGALIGAGGYGQPILTGIRLDDYGIILEGALPAAGLALLAQAVFEISERFLVPAGLRRAAAARDTGK